MWNNFIPDSSKDIANDKILQNYVKVQDQGHKVKSLGTKERPLHEVSICEISEPYPQWFKKYSSG
jgi:hypothetical protein